MCEETNKSGSVWTMSVLSAGGDTELRHVEKDVLIPKKMREKAMLLCADYVKEFEECIRGRTVSMVWACQESNKRMKECLTQHYRDPDFYERCKEEYLRERSEFRQTGVRNSTKRTD